MKRFKQELLSKLSLPKKQADLLPSGYQKIGDIVLLKLNPKLKNIQKEIGLAAKDILNSESVCVIESIDGAARRPKIKLIAGKTETVHTEYGCKFALDVSKTMWSKGNHREKARLAKMIKPDEKIVDMFAGIGYWSIPVAKTQPDCSIFAIDINPVAIKYLEKSIRLNGIGNITPILGDCQKVEIGEKADRVIMGWLFETEKFFPKAIDFLKSKGIIHYHFLTNDKNFGKEFGKIKKIAERHGRKTKVLYKGIVKSYGPKTWHGVMDLELRK